ncbi:MAG: sigma-70 region 4 domain-containing protein [Solirubrobacteraceae bacterium]
MQWTDARHSSSLRDCDHARPRPHGPVGSARDRCEALEPLSLLAGLPERRRTFLASKVGGYSYEEIVAQLDVSWRMVDRRWCGREERSRARAIAPDRLPHRMGTRWGALVTANGPDVRAFRI